MERAALRIYMGYAAGVGKTSAMLGEGRRQRELGIDIVVAFVEPHGRAPVLERLRGLEVVPLRRVAYQGRLFPEMDLDAILARRPRVALVDELAHSNIPGSRNQFRWQDVAELLDAGITVLSTLNIQHLESLNDVVERITRTRQRTTIPDAVLADAEVELVDLAPWALRRRLADGESFPADQVDAALANYFQEPNLTALRELALRWMATRVDGTLRARLDGQADLGSWETRERVVVALSGRADGERVIRRTARVAANRHGELLAVHVTTGNEPAGDAAALTRQRELVAELGGTLHEVTANDVPGGLLAFARAERATLLMVGTSTSPWWSRLLNGSVLGRIVRAAGDIDVHVVSLEDVPAERLAPPRAGSLPPRRRLAALAVAGLGLPALTSLLLPLRDQANLSSVLLAYLTLVVAVATIGGWWPAVLAALAASALGNYYFTQPYDTWRISDPDNIVALVVFLLVAIVVSTLVAVAERRRHQAQRGRSEAEALARLAGSLLASPDPTISLLQHLKTTFNQDAAAVLSRQDGRWQVQAAVGPPLPDPDRATESIPLGHDGAVLALQGPSPPAADRQVLAASAALLSLAVHSRQLIQRADRIAEQQAANELRRAILDAVSHDLRTPLASIKAAVTGLREPGGDVSAEVISDSLALIEEEADRLNTLVGNLLDMSRIQAGAVTLACSPIGLDEVVPRALASLRRHDGPLIVDVPESLPRVHADPGLLERAVANIIDNALAWSPATEPVRVHASAVDDEPQLVRVLRVHLQARGYQVDAAPDGRGALELAARSLTDVVVLDLGLPDISGVEVIAGLRGWTQVPIIILSVHGEEADKITALDAGADDYVTKPFSMAELLARVRAAGRRAPAAKRPPLVSTDDFVVDLAAKRVTTGNGDVRLTPTEWHLVELLVTNPGRLVSQRQLLREVWGPHAAAETGYLRVYMAQIRRKLEPQPSQPRYFITEPGMGYRFEAASPQDQDGERQP